MATHYCISIAKMQSDPLINICIRILTVIRQNRNRDSREIDPSFFISLHFFSASGNVILDIKRSLKQRGKLVRAAHGPCGVERSIQISAHYEISDIRVVREVLFYSQPREGLSSGISMSRTVYPTPRLRGTRWKIVVINGDRGRRLERKRKKYALTYMRAHRETENGSRSDNSRRRTLAWPAKRLYAVCVLYGNTARVPTPIFIHCRYNALLLPPGTIHPQARTGTASASLLQTGRRGSWPAVVIRFRYII